MCLDLLIHPVARYPRSSTRRRATARPTRGREPGTATDRETAPRHPLAPNTHTQRERDGERGREAATRERETRDRETRDRETESAMLVWLFFGKGDEAETARGRQRADTDTLPAWLDPEIQRDWDVLGTEREREKETEALLSASFWELIDRETET